jgi:hypothetical protein
VWHCMGTQAPDRPLHSDAVRSGSRSEWGTHGQTHGGTCSVAQPLTVPASWVASVRAANQTAQLRDVHAQLDADIARCVGGGGASSSGRDGQACGCGTGSRQHTLPRTTTAAPAPSPWVAVAPEAAVASWARRRVYGLRR